MPALRLLLLWPSSWNLLALRSSDVQSTNREVARAWGSGHHKPFERKSNRIEWKPLNEVQQIPSRREDLGLSSRNKIFQRTWKLCGFLGCQTLQWYWFNSPFFRCSSCWFLGSVVFILHIEGVGGGWMRGQATDKFAASSKVSYVTLDFGE